MRSPLAGALLLAFAAIGCNVELEHGLDERQANHIAALLDEHGVAADKLRDDGTDGWKIAVPRAELARSFQLLDTYDLPKRGRKGLTETLADRGLLPSLGEEQARLESARAVELERSFEGVPGIVSARVHLALPDNSRLDGIVSPAGAAVLLRSNGTAAITEAQVRAIVAGATTGLTPDAVQVVITGGTTPPPSQPTESVGPLQVARGERGRVVAIAASGLALLVALGAALLFTALRLSSLRARASDQSSPSRRNG